MLCTFMPSMGNEWTKKSVQSISSQAHKYYILLLKY